MRYAAYLLAMANGAGLVGLWALAVVLVLLLVASRREAASFASLGVAAEPNGFVVSLLPAVVTFGMGLLIDALL